MESYYDNNLAVTQQMKLEMMQKMQQQQLQTPDPATKSRRAFWTDEEVHRLQELFNINPYPDQQAKRQLRYCVNWWAHFNKSYSSEELQKELSKITNWFKNERARKNIKRESGTPSRKSPESKTSPTLIKRLPTLDATMPLMLLPKIEAHVNALVTPAPTPPTLQVSTTPTKSSPINIEPALPAEDITFTVNPHHLKVKKRKLSSDLGVSGEFYLLTN